MHGPDRYSHPSVLVVPGVCFSRPFELTCCTRFIPAMFWHPPKLQAQRVSHDRDVSRQPAFVNTPQCLQHLEPSNSGMLCSFLSISSVEMSPPDLVPWPQRIGSKHKLINRELSNVLGLKPSFCVLFGWGLCCSPRRSIVSSAGATASHTTGGRADAGRTNIGQTGGRTGGRPTGGRAGEQADEQRARTQREHTTRTQ